MEKVPQVSPRRLRELIDKFGSKRVLVCGDLMLDHYIRGRVQRISPEAPVPVLQVSSETHVPGGAGNVCNNIAALGASVTVLSAVGTEPAGELLLADLRARGVDTGAVLQESERTTTQKCRLIGEHQQLLRYDRETSHPVSRRLEKALIAALQEHVQRSQAIVISDYGKGVVTPNVLQAAIKEARKRSIPITVDPKIEHFQRYKGVDCITPNMHEAWAGMRVLPKDGEEPVRDLGWKILRVLNARSVLITRGERGMTLFENSKVPKSITHIPAQAKEVFDVTGAGDTVISVLALALACGASLKEAAVLANQAAGVVVGKLGTATVSVPELRAAIA